MNAAKDVITVQGLELSGERASVISIVRLISKQAWMEHGRAPLRATHGYPPTIAPNQGKPGNITEISYQPRVGIG